RVNVLFADAAVRNLDMSRVRPQDLKAAITRAGGEFQTPGWEEGGPMIPMGPGAKDGPGNKGKGGGKGGAKGGGPSPPPPEDKPPPPKEPTPPPKEAGPPPGNPDERP